jgi:hypothetical protein
LMYRPEILCGTAVILRGHTKPVKAVSFFLVLSNLTDVVNLCNYLTDGGFIALTTKALYLRDTCVYIVYTHIYVCIYITQLQI